jgi:WXG100 family type VII secretion target
MTQIRVTPEELENISSQLNNKAGTVSDQITQATAMITNLVSQGWAGSASSQFNEIWSKWDTGAKQIHQAMLDMSTYLKSAAGAYRDVDEQLAKGLGG